MIDSKNLKIVQMTEDSLKFFENNILDFDEFWSYKLLKQELENENSTCLVAYLDDKVVGFACLWEPPFEIHINNIAVKKDYRNQKIGTFILEELIKIAKEKNKEEMTLEVNVNNIYAIKLYKKYNFEVVGTRKKYYNNTDDAFIMTKKII